MPIKYIKPARHPWVVFRSHRAHRTVTCLTPPILPLFCQQWPLPPPTSPSVRLVSPAKDILVSLVCSCAIPRPAPAYSSALSGRTLSPAPLLFLRYACALFPASPALFLSLLQCFNSHCVGALPVFDERSPPRYAGNRVGALPRMAPGMHKE